MVFLLWSGDKRSASSTLTVSGSEMSLGCGEKEEEDEGCFGEPNCTAAPDNVRGAMDIQKCLI